MGRIPDIKKKWNISYHDQLEWSKFVKIKIFFDGFASKKANYDMAFNGASFQPSKDQRILAEFSPDLHDKALAFCKRMINVQKAKEVKTEQIASKNIDGNGYAINQVINDENKSRWKNYRVHASGKTYYLGHNGERFASTRDMHDLMIDENLYQWLMEMFPDLYFSGH